MYELIRTIPPHTFFWVVFGSIVYGAVTVCVGMGAFTYFLNQLYLTGRQVIAYTLREMLIWPLRLLALIFRFLLTVPHYP